MSRTVRTNKTVSNTYTTNTCVMLDDCDNSMYLLSNEGENGLLFCLTDADGIQDLTSCFLHLTFPRLVLPFARVLVLLRAEGIQSCPSSSFFVHPVV